MGFVSSAIRRHPTLSLPFLAVLLLGCTGGETPSETPSQAAGVAVGPVEARPDRHALKVAEPRELRTRDGLLVISWSPVGGEVPVNEHFEADVTVRRAGASTADAPSNPLLEDAEVSMTCFMPAHGHGMLREPRTEHIGDGVYRVRGLLLHMGGEWSISISASIDGLASTAITL
jgi:hypothetical protein